MTETTQTPEIPLAIKKNTETGKTPEYTIIPSLVEKKDFSPEEINGINAKIKSLQEKVNSNLKKHEEKLIMTPEKLEALRQEINAKKAPEKNETTGKLTQEEIDATITEDKFEKTDIVPDTVQSPLESAKTAITAFKDGKPEEGLRAIEGSGILPNNFVKKILEFFYTLFGDSRISMDQSTMFERQVAPAIESLGISIQNLPNKNDIKVLVMQKLSGLGVPVEYSDKFFQFIKGSSTSNDVPQKLLLIFQAGKAHYKEIKDSLSSDPKVALESILDFTPPKTETSPEPNPDTQTTNKAPEKIKIGEKEITGTPEEMAAYTSLEKTAKNILGKNFDVKSSLTAMKQGNESELTTISRDIFFKIVSRIKEVYGDTFADSLTGKDVTDDDKKLLKLDYLELNKKTPKTIMETLDKNLGNIFWSGAKALETDINKWSGEDATKKEIAQKLLRSIKGYQSKEGEKGAADFQSEIAKGYDVLMAQNIGQTLDWKKLRTTVLTDKADNLILQAYNASTPVLKTEIM